ncbi:MAG TPA: monofunctional biosynthetic peptidoglycan transglycosylase [Thermoanaerobaculia bacterium]|nr:monofunctional biosynthetic peptidoglycan transglycosylase [Thermoanaerobaculia bacterium]
MEPEDPRGDRPSPKEAEPDADPSGTRPTEPAARSWEEATVVLPAEEEPPAPVEEPAPPPADQPAERTTPVPAEEPAAPPPPRRRLGCGRVLLVLLALAAAWLLWELVTWPDVAALATENPESTAFIRRYERRSGQEARHTWVAYGAISPHLKRAVLVGEDINFFSHDGFDQGELEIALRDAWAEKRFPRGASTVTQQLAKNLWLSSSRNPLRKVKEALLTRELERHLTKQRILELYLNAVELGPGIYGAEAAARHYFGRSAAGLSEWQAASLAAGLPNPDAWHPGSGSRAYQNRVRTLLRRMGKAGFLWREI